MTDAGPGTGYPPGGYGSQLLWVEFLARETAHQFFRANSLVTCPGAISVFGNECGNKGG